MSTCQVLAGYRQVSMLRDRAGAVLKQVHTSEKKVTPDPVFMYRMKIIPLYLHHTTVQTCVTCHVFQPYGKI